MKHDTRHTPFQGPRLRLLPSNRDPAQGMQHIILPIQASTSLQVRDSPLRHPPGLMTHWILSMISEGIVVG